MLEIPIMKIESFGIFNWKLVIFLSENENFWNFESCVESNDHVFKLATWGNQYFSNFTEYSVK